MANSQNICGKIGQQLDSEIRIPKLLGVSPKKRISCTASANSGNKDGAKAHERSDYLKITSFQPICQSLAVTSSQMRIQSNQDVGCIQSKKEFVVEAYFRDRKLSGAPEQPVNNLIRDFEIRATQKFLSLPLV